MKKLFLLLLIVSPLAHSATIFPPGGTSGGNATNAIGKTNGLGFGVTTIDKLIATNITLTGSGNITTANGTNSAKNFIASSNLLGANFVAELTNSVNVTQIGIGALATQDAVAVGNGAHADQHSVGVGIGVTVVGGVGVGENSGASDNSVVIGSQSSAVTESITIGQFGLSGVNSISIGNSSSANNRAIALGNNCVSSNMSIAIGDTVSSGVGRSNIVIGAGSSISGVRTNAIQIGRGSVAQNNFFKVGGGNADNGFDVDLSSGTLTANLGIFNSQFAADGGLIASGGDGSLNVESVTANGAGGFSGIGTGVTALNAANVTSGILPAARLISSQNVSVFTLVQTNFISGFIYTNFYGAPIEVSTTAILTVTTVAGDATLEARAINSATNKFTIQTVVGTLGTTNGSYLAVKVPVNGTYTFTNTSAGSGDSATLQGGQIFVY